ncbi:MAG TPA: YchF/TatD family DNA exonuclease [Dissulfurispiraceae bacterium]|nr:YchF/TatD family DNA exonuclease [Dissulfurispiraceae bacterium]
MIDTHCHLEMKQFDEDRTAVIDRARASGIEYMITVASDLNGCESAVRLAEKHDCIFAAVGLHPHDAKDYSNATFERIMELSRSPKVVAIGEMGLDYYYDHSAREIQRTVFAEQLAFAKERDLPAIVHSRDAQEDTLRIMENSGVRKGVMHCFSGDVAMAKRAIALGFHISLAGPVTFRNAAELREVAQMVPDDLLLIETDAPYLSPEPMRGKRNEPACLVHTAKHIAELRGITIEDLDRLTTLNAQRLFGIGKLPEAKFTYAIRDSLYLNVTNRCTSACTFCVRFHSDFVKGHNLMLDREPTAEELIEEIADPARYREIVFCGYGEPMLRLDVVKMVASWVKQNGGHVRINTNGQGNLINKRNVLPELHGLVDVVSVSMNAHDAETYERVSRPSFPGAYSGVIDFIREAKNHIPDVRVTVVTAEGVDVARCRQIADELGVPLRVRKLDVVG